MANNVVRLENSKKHYTKKEVAAKKKAEASIVRKTITLKVPPRIKSSADSYSYWKSIVKNMKELEIIDDLDSDMLAIHCEQLAIRDSIFDTYILSKDKDTLKTLQAQERLIAQYADKLGLTPGGRMRLAKKKADKEIDENADLF